MTTRVLIVDDSSVARYALRAALAPDPDICVVAETATGEEALRLVEQTRPDIVTMDVFLRAENGIEVAAAIMGRCAVPILVVTAKNPTDPKLLYAALQAGALDVWAKPPPAASPQYEEQRGRLARVLKALARVPVVHRRRRPGLPPMAAGDAEPALTPAQGGTEREVVLLGASTGGPPVLAEVLAALPAPFGLPIVIVQHMAPGFSDGFARWLGDASGHEVEVVEGHTPIAPGSVLLAPPARHLVFQSPTTVAPIDGASRDYQRPSVNILFESAARHLGARVAAVVLTGMGRDGTDGLAALKAEGALSLVQTPRSCAVGSMPKNALAAGVVDAALEPAAIAARLRSLVPAATIEPTTTWEDRP